MLTGRCMANATAKPPHKRRKEARPSELIEAGLKEFARSGFAATKLEDVASRAGVSKATIYVYFEDKRALFEACMTSRLTPIVSNATDLIDAFPGSTEQLLRTLVPMIHHAFAQGDARELMSIIIAESGKFPFLAEMHHRESVSKGKAIMERIVARGIARGEFRDGDYARMPMVIAAPAVMATLWSLMFQRIDPIDAEAVIAAHIDLVLNGVLRRPP